ncbi:MAG: ABC transporter ATP-binding protein [Anaerolineales bacterium]|nr:ABC transporter ATP-binding protein [Anaerolineales bacterium]
MKNSTKAQTSPKELMRFFSRYLRPYWRLVLVLIVCYFFVSLLTAIQPLVMAPMLDIVLGDMTLAGSGTTLLPPTLQEIDLNNVGAYLLAWLGSFDLSRWEIVWIMALTYLALALLLQLLNFAVYLLAVWIRVGSERDIQTDLFGHVLSLSLDFFHRKRTGELISRLDQDTRATVSGLAVIVRSIVVSSILTVVYSTLLLRTNVRLTIFIIIAGALHYGLTQIIRNPIKQRVRDQFNAMADSTAYIQEAISAVRVVKSFVAEAYEHARLRNIVERLRSVIFRFGIFKHIDEPIGQMINTVSNVAILLLATNELFGSSLTPTGFFLYLYIGRAVLDPITDLTRTYTMLQTTMATSERVYELFSERPSIISGSKPIRQLEREVHFDRVSFAYADSSVLSNVDIHIRKGEITALVGPSGAGKSTVTDLLLRFYDPDKGRILVDGVDLKQLDLEAYRRLFGVVSQESLLFNASVFENIAYPGLDVSREEAEEAAQIANAHEFIQQMPRGYDSLIGDRGVLVSGGQRQRLAIARAVIRKPQILLLDEATSSLDSGSEKLVQEAIDRVIRGTTAVIIAHRLSTVVKANQIVVIDRGQVVDSGTHGDLMERCPLYQELAMLQLNAQA